MGKIVKYCSSCDEGFAERFGFCPDCGAPLQAFEMNPVENEIGLEENSVETVSAEPTPVDNEIDATPVEVEPEAPTPVFLEADEDEFGDEEVDEPAYESVSARAASPALFQSSPMYADEPRGSVDDATNWDYTHADDGGFYVTVIQEKNGKQRNVLLLGAAALMLVLTVGSWGVSLFQKSLDVGAIGSEGSLAYLIDEVPMPVEEEPKKAKDDDAGGGGGGGKQQPDPVNQGDLPDQTKNPIRPPDPNVHRSDNFELQTPPPSTEGERKFEKKFGQWGDPTSTYGKLSSGPGSGGGMGTGYGTGVGSGSGTGTGSGSGSGYGSGNGDGDGDGSGSGRGGGSPPAPIVAKVTSPLRIISKPRATYTDAARTNAVTGSVLLKVTLLASGQVGSITPVKRLPHGLTEQAIAAARQIKFEPKKVNGVPVSSIITLDYGFTIY
ncbi:MAG TPA: TonB family protein [Pyrinomonadaceae bacterium]